MSMNALTGNIGSIATCPIRPCVHNDAPDVLVGRSARIVLVNLVAPHAGELGFGSQRIHSSRSAAFFSHRLDPSGLGFRDEALDRHLGHVSGFGYLEASKTPFQPDRRWQGCRDLRSREAAPDFPWPEAPTFTRLRACGSFQRDTLHIVIGLAALTREA